ncbi:MAG TPA: hypothetical protein VH369_08780, partial [Bryobacteraceae bacterium]
TRKIRKPPLSEQRGSERSQEHKACALRIFFGNAVITFLLWCLLLLISWPLALGALVLYPIVWLLLLPFRVVGIAVHGALELISAVILLPARALRAVTAR